MSKLYDCGRLYAVFGRSGDLPCLGIPERLHIQSRSLYEAARSLPSTPANASGAYHLPRYNAAMISRPKAKAYSYTIRVAPPVPHKIGRRCLPTLLSISWQATRTSEARTGSLWATPPGHKNGHYVLRPPVERTVVVWPRDPSDSALSFRPSSCRRGERLINPQPPDSSTKPRWRH